MCTCGHGAILSMQCLPVWVGDNYACTVNIMLSCKLCGCFQFVHMRS